MQCDKIEKLGPWGNQGATNWSVKFGEHETIKEVTISHGSIVDGIRFTVANACGKTTTTWFVGHAVKSDEIALKPNEYISQVSRTHAEWRIDGYKHHISSLKIHTNLNPCGYGPYVLQKDVRNTVCFSSPMPLDGIITGFLGKVERYLDSIGIYVNKLHETIKEVAISHGSIVDGIGFTVDSGCGATTTTWFGGHAVKTAPECFGLCSYLLSGYTKKDVRSNEATTKYLLMGGASSSILIHGFS